MLKKEIASWMTGSLKIVASIFWKSAWLVFGSRFLIKSSHSLTFGLQSPM